MQKNAKNYTVAEYKDGTPAVWLEIGEEESGHVVETFDMDDVHTATEAIGGDGKKELNKLFSMWAVHSYMNKKFDLKKYAAEPWVTISMGQRTIEVKPIAFYQTNGKLYFSKDYKVKHDALVVVAPWMGHKEKKMRLIGWANAKTLRVKSSKEERYRKIVKTLAYKKLNSMETFIDIWRT